MSHVSSDNPVPVKSSRTPQQTRGRARVEAVLDACAILLWEEGPGELTMHKLAKRAKTSIGSLYHFFPDKDAVIDALCQRHLAAMSDITLELDQISLEQWRGMSTQAVIESLARPYFQYIDAYPEMLVIISNSLGSKTEDAPALRRSIHANYEKVLELRMPALDTELLKTISFVLYNIPVGALQSLQDNNQYRERVLRTELIHAMVAYLQTIEAQHATGH
ncbi:TetR/AcrR family transcriptional regulator [Halopseudomonas pelagia]|uniref:TetR/AcrR family transcriptional regulator n=1 Tax=Halopseudomonas pelagia TaxID=553151 RepID=UPI0003B302F1|nr:TetR/AcrR family transcriptional regulator [Halopseudomonas pelagia]